MPPKTKKGPAAIARPIEVGYKLRMRNDHEPVASIVGVVGAIIVVVPAAAWLKAKGDEWPLPFYLLFCGAILAVIFLIARLMDKREADRLRRESGRSHWRELDLPPTDYRSQSSHGKQE